MSQNNAQAVSQFEKLKFVEASVVTMDDGLEQRRAAVEGAAGDRAGELLRDQVHLRGELVALEEPYGRDPPKEWIEE